MVRFWTPTDGVVAFDDMVKGRIEFSNAELDDLIIARPDGTPTYNFCVVVDDWDMSISHVIRGDDHVNNTPRQINMLRALGVEPPLYAHVPMILGDDGERLSKRHGAVNVIQYRGRRLPAGSHGQLSRPPRLVARRRRDLLDASKFCEWFDLDHITPSAAQFNTEKLNWLNEQYLKHGRQHSPGRTGAKAPRTSTVCDLSPEQPSLEGVIGL